VSAPSNAASPRDFIAGLYDAFARGGVQTILDALAPNVLWSEAEGHPLGQSEPFKGPDAVLQNVFMRLATEWDGFKVVPTRLTAEGNRVVVEGRYTGRNKASNTAMDAQFVHAWTIGNGKVTEFQQYTDTAQWQRVMGPAPGAGLNRVVHFEIGADDPERCAKFFTEVFGWQITKWDGPQPYWLCTTGQGAAGINGGIMRHQDGKARTINTIEVESIEAAIERVKKAGGDVCVPKMPAPGVGWLAYCTDTEGGIHGVFVPDPAAK
jgi:predicted enzyme related to lactoylglutathione lyase/ketosteroid isomerase-like protein